MRGDGEAFLQLAEINKEDGDFLAAFMHYGLAAEFLPEGRARDLSVIGREESRGLLTPDKQAIVDEGLRQNIKLVHSLVEFLEDGR